MIYLVISLIFILYAFGIYKIDFKKPEPILYSIIVCFSGIMASLCAFALNSFISVYLPYKIFIGVVGPIQEELIKILFLFLFFSLVEKETDQIFDWFIYGALCGIGFSAGETMHYTIIDNDSWILRTLIIWFLHPLWTGMLCQGFGFVYHQRYMAGFSLLISPIILHTAWNISGLFYPTNHLLLYFLCLLPLFIGIIIYLIRIQICKKSQ